MSEKKAYIGLGSNLGDRHKSIKNAIKMLTETQGVKITKTSDVIETSALGDGTQPVYLNAVAEISTTLSPEDLHQEMRRIEAALGRTRKQRWGPRTIDLDLLLHNQQVVNRRDLTIPHPQMHLRSFVLKGLCQLNPEMPHPVIKEPMNQLADRLNDADYALNPDSAQLVNIAGVIGVGKTTLAKKLSELLDCEAIFEAYDENPFMPEVYAGRKELALDSQLFFLASRIKQLNTNELEQGKVAISDYVFDKELIYAKRLLSAKQLSGYRQSYKTVACKVAQPVLVIYLTDSVQNCLKRIRRRNRSYEQKIEPAFLEELRNDYEQLFADWKRCPVIRVSMSGLSREKDGVENLAHQMRNYVAVKI